MRIRRWIAFAFVSLALSFPSRAQDSSPRQTSATSPGPRLTTIDDYVQIRNVAQPELSPDGQWVAYAVRTKMLKEDKNEQRIWMVSTRGAEYEIALGYPWEQKALWDKISPFYRVKNITTATLFMGGEIDSIVPIFGSEQMFEAMTAPGRTMELVVYPNEYHASRRRTSRTASSVTSPGTNAHYVKGDGTPALPPEKPAAPETKAAGGE